MRGAFAASLPGFPPKASAQWVRGPLPGPTRGGAQVCGAEKSESRARVTAPHSAAAGMRVRVRVRGSESGSGSEPSGR